MTIAVKAVDENGVFKPKVPVELQEKTEVDVLIPVEEPANERDPTGWKAIDALVGSVRRPLGRVREARRIPLPQPPPLILLDTAQRR